jgi:phospholipase C
MHSPLWNETALIINYDESGGELSIFYFRPRDLALKLSLPLTPGFYDHVVPPQAPQSEWVTDKYNGQKAYIGFGPRVPIVCVSPYCRGGNVFTEVSDHTATLRLLEEWIGKNANGTYKAPASLISPWSRATTSDLVNLFDFANPDFSIPVLPTIAKPAQNAQGVWDPTEMCEG